MDAFSYLSVLLSIILGLALTQLLQGLRGIALHRARVRLYWPVLAWCATLVLVFVQSWWAMFALRKHTDWSFVQFFVVILQTVFLYMLAGVVLPDFDDEHTVDLRAHYFAQRRLFQLVLVGAGLASVVKDLVIDHRLPNGPNLAFHLFFIVLAATAATTTNERYHKSLAVVALVGFTLYSVLLFSVLSQV